MHFRTVNTPARLQFISRFVLQPLRPLLHYKDHTIRTAAEAGLDVAELAVGPAFVVARGYFTLRQADTSSAESRDPTKQQQLWEKTLEWLGMTEEQGAL
uniref:Dehydrogenase acuH n=1 Tax=Aspergillus aculeatus (strain ATCC 16872 / CBS 172.66 / WB 5094) TaxID=690307 RepID=ACUH_ASPA1|nr:RecName: Full=Dehydrogenase acuH; AltName: Full=Aculin biosynthesis cluster protein H [Aspergillus aculeatus ATCC 16872]